MSNPLVSVLMASYNYGHYVEQAVRSVWAQDYRPLELVVVDDGSADNTLDTLEGLARLSPMPMNVVRSPHKGVSGALNMGLPECRGEYVSLLHADDFYREDKITKQVDAIRAAGSDAVVVHSEYVVVDEEGRLTGHSSADDIPPASGRALDDLLLVRADMRSMTPLYRRSALLQIGGYDEEYPTEDWACFLRLAAIGTVVHVDEPLVYRRVHPRNHGTMTSRAQVFTPAHYGHGVIVEVTPPYLPLDRVLALAAVTAVRHAYGVGGWRKAMEGSKHVWRSFPGQRHRLVAASFSGMKSYVWQRYIKDRLPRSLRAGLLAGRQKLRYVTTRQN
jgi:glycosyltransferase involved in cell wall biosynthesis